MDNKNWMESFLNSRKEIPYLISLFFVVLIIMFGVTVARSAHYLYQGGEETSSSYSSETAGLSFTGIGKVLVIPDSAKFSVTIEEKGERFEDTQVNINKKVDRLKEDLKQFGIPEANISVIDYTILNQADCDSGTYYDENYSDYVGGGCYYEEYSNYDDQGGIVNEKLKSLNLFNISQVLEITIDSLDDVTKTLEYVNNIDYIDVVDGLTFVSKDQAKHKEQARMLAVKDATKQAEAVAKELNMTLGKIISYSDYSYDGGSGQIVFEATISFDLK